MLSACAHLRNAPRVAAAHHIVALYREMHDALDEYRELLPREHHATGTDDFPF